MQRKRHSFLSPSSAGGIIQVRMLLWDHGNRVVPLSRGPLSSSECSQRPHKPQRMTVSCHYSYCSRQTDYQAHTILTNDDSNLLPAPFFPADDSPAPVTVKATMTILIHRTIDEVSEKHCTAHHCHAAVPVVA